jgi:mannitol/fructose-specific phosphotransferase system IIA component (Ntr-type)
MIVELQGADRWQVIDELIDHLVVAGKIEAQNRDLIASAVRKREMSMSTGIGFGIAIPHASTHLVSEVVQVFGRSKTGVEFGSLDGELVYKVCLFLVPQGEFQKHVHTLANVAKMLHKGDFGEDIKF